MSELIDHRRDRAHFQRQLLATASTLMLTAYIASADFAKAEDADRPTAWIELGGQMETLQGTSTPFMSPFMTAVSPLPDAYGNDIFIHAQRPARLAFGLKGKASFQPEGSDWIFSASLLYGRSNTNRHVHQQGPQATAVWNFFGAKNFYAATFADTRLKYEESHTVLDFMAGKDVGLGRFGHDGTSTINAGIRFAQFSNKSDVSATGRPSIQFFVAYYGKSIPTFHNYTMFAHSERSFRGVGPSLSWNASAAIVGNKDDGEVTLDWGANAAVLFGRQKAKTSHASQAYHMPFTPYTFYWNAHYTRTQYNPAHPQVRSRSVTIPNLGGFAGVSVKYPNVKFSLGYRADFFFGAVDAGIDERHTKNLGFSGPFATISIGLGG